MAHNSSGKTHHQVSRLSFATPNGVGMISSGSLRQFASRKAMFLAITLTALLFTYVTSSYRPAPGPVEPKQPKGIPRIVHLVQLSPSADAEVEFSFQSFLCVYTAYHFIQPSTIFIHTNHNQSKLDYAVENGTLWTRKILTAFPGTLQINQVVPPTLAANGLTISRIEHKSDFVRMEQVAAHGGIYLDWDVLTLRSPAPLLGAGFAAVVGRQADGNINNGCFMAARGSALVRLMNRDMPAEFSGEWQHHSTGLITPIAQRIAYAPGEVLILDDKAFAPTSWLDASAAQLFSEQDEAEGPAPPAGLVNVDTVDPVARWENRTTERLWEMDFSQTYFLHAFKAARAHPPRFDGISLAYVLRRKSNYAAAAWPAVMQAMRDGIIDEADGDA